MKNDFSSMERLMEIGMSMAVAQQMVSTMNHALGNMSVAGVSNAIPTPKPIEYYVAIDGAQAGPFTEEEVRKLIENGRITDDNLVWYAGLSGWRRAKDVPAINKWLLLSNPLK